ncbi:hypothetical protein KGD82_21090 [Nocardiopsis eucommiae]|uniref:Uncharacterized protein n=1 Tax=Nocardiopsis eucommiae TaxID=2831970 RepID=A0A975L945_9ACTN|nr:hypothetical protein KGD82_21090 [Nocardiopsis eucommiae]
METDTLTLPEMCTGEPGIYIPDRGMVLATFQEVVNGNTIPGFGVLDEHGTFTALSPEQEVSDFATPIEYLHSVADPEGDRILFVEDNGEDTLSIQAMDLENGEITDIGNCPKLQCQNLTVIPGLDAAVMGNLPYNDLLPVLGGSAIIASTGSGNMHFIDLGEHANDDVINLDEVFDTREILGSDPGPDSPPNVVVEGRGPITAIDDNSVVFEDNVLTVWEFTETTFTDYEAEHSDTLQYERPALPATATLVPEGPRENSDPNVSPDGTEVIFLSNPQTGGSSWYRVPVDGSSEPEEFPEFPSNVTVLSWT